MKPGDLVRSVAFTDQYFTNKPNRIGYENMESRRVPKGALGVVLQEPVEMPWATGIYFVEWVTSGGTPGWTYSSHLATL